MGWNVKLLKVLLEDRLLSQQRELWLEPHFVHAPHLAGGIEVIRGIGYEARRTPTRPGSLAALHPRFVLPIVKRGVKMRDYHA